MLADTFSPIFITRKPPLDPELLNEWLRKEETVGNQVRKFNQKVSNSTLTVEELKVISEIVTREVSRLTELTEVAEHRENELNQHQYCFNTTSKELRRLYIIDGCAKLILLGGMMTTYFAHDPRVEAIGFSFGIAGFAFDYLAQNYGVWIQVRQFETAELARFNKENAEGAKTFKDFLLRLIEVKKIEAELVERNRNLSSPLAQYPTHKDSIPLDEECQKAVEQAIGNCLREYEKLPRCFQNKKVYCRVLSDLIYGLPDEHRLAKDFKQLEPDLGKTASLPIHTDYLERGDIQSDKQGAKSDSSFFFKWIHSTEEKPRKTFKRTSSSGSLTETPRDRKTSDTDYKDQVSFFKNQLKDRLGLTSDIPYLETESGWQISDIEDITPASLIYEEDDEEINFMEIRAPLLAEKSTGNFPLNSDEMV